MCYLRINLFLTGIISRFFDIFVCNQIEKTAIVNRCLVQFISTTVLIYKTFSLSITMMKLAGGACNRVRYQHYLPALFDRSPNRLGLYQRFDLREYHHL